MCCYRVELKTDSPLVVNEMEDVRPNFHLLGSCRRCMAREAAAETGGRSSLRNPSTELGKAFEREEAKKESSFL